MQAPSVDWPDQNSSLIHTMPGLNFVSHRFLIHNLRHQTHADHAELHKLESDKFTDPKREDASAAYLVHIQYTHTAPYKS